MQKETRKVDEKVSQIYQETIENKTKTNIFSAKVYAVKDLIFHYIIKFNILQTESYIKFISKKSKFLNRLNRQNL